MQLPHKLFIVTIRSRNKLFGGRDFSEQEFKDSGFKVKKEEIGMAYIVSKLNGAMIGFA